MRMIYQLHTSQYYLYKPKKLLQKARHKNPPGLFHAATLK